MNLYIYCAGAFGKEVMDIARRRNAVSGSWRDIFFIDDVISEDEKYGATVWSFFELMHKDLLGEGEFVIANGEPSARKAISEKLNRAGARYGNLIDTSALISASSVLGEGSVIAPYCSISSDAVLSANACINTMSIVGHDVRIGHHAVISSMVNLGGGCTVGDGSYIGMGALIKEDVHIGANTIVGMGAVVYNDIPDGVIALGNPARVMRKNSDQKVFK